MKKSITVKRKKRGRPATGVDPFFGFRMPAELAERVDDWGVSHEPPLTRSEAIRALIERGLAGREARDVPVLGSVSSGKPKPLRR